MIKILNRKKGLLIVITILLVVVSIIFFTNKNNSKSISLETNIKEVNEDKAFLLDYISVVADLKEIENSGSDDPLLEINDKAELNSLKISKWKSSDNYSIKESTRLLLASLNYLSEASSTELVDEFQSKLSLFHQSLSLSGMEISKKENDLKLTEAEKKEIINYIYKSSKFDVNEIINELDNPESRFTGWDSALYSVMIFATQ